MKTILCKAKFFICTIFLVFNITTMNYNWEQEPYKVYSLAGSKRDIILLKNSSDESLLVTVDTENMACIWDAQTGKLRRSFTTHTDKEVKNLCYAVAFSPDDTVLAFGHSNSSITLWDVASGSLLATIQDVRPTFLQFLSLPLNNTKMPCLLIFQEGQYDSKIIYYNLKTRERIGNLEQEKAIKALDLKNNTIVFADKNGEIAVYDFLNQKTIGIFKLPCIPQQHSTINYNCALSENLLAIAAENKIDIWDITNNKLLDSLIVPKINENEIVHRGIDFNNDSRHLYINCAMKIDYRKHYIIDYDLEKKMNTILGEPSLDAFKKSPDAKYYISIGLENKNYAKIYSTETQKLIKEVPCFSFLGEWQPGLNVSPSGKHIACVTTEKNILLYLFHKKFFKYVPQRLCDVHFTFTH